MTDVQNALILTITRDMDRMIFYPTHVRIDEILDPDAESNNFYSVYECIESGISNIWLQHRGME